MSTIETEALNAYQLANLADCGTPDKAGQLFGKDHHDPSPGAKFLLSVQEAVENYPTDQGGPTATWEEFDKYDAAHGIADDAVPIYTHDLWATFVDLAAYSEDVSELPGDGQDMGDLAKVALYMIAERLALQLLEEAGTDGE